MDGMNMQQMLEGLISILLTIITYYLNGISQDMKQFKKDYADLRKLCNWLVAEQMVMKTALEGISKPKKRTVVKPD
jgi:site-specific recombinase XerC